MCMIQATAAGGPILSAAQIRETLAQGPAAPFRGQRLLVLIPDHTHTSPLPSLFRELVGLVAAPKQLDPADWADREDEGALSLPKAGAMLYRRH